MQVLSDKKASMQRSRLRIGEKHIVPIISKGRSALQAESIYVVLPFTGPPNGR